MNDLRVDAFVLLFDYSTKRERHPLFVAQVIRATFKGRAKTQESAELGYAGRYGRRRVQDGSREQNVVSVKA